jgi:Glycosyl hydrolases family 18/S-layer homology domain
MKKTISLILIFIIAFSFTAAAPNDETSFNDVPRGHYFEEYIYKLKELNITNGIGNGAFGFNYDITRAEFLTFLVRLQGQELDKIPRAEMFKDIKTDIWYYPYINMGLKNKTILSNEYSDGNFYPNKPITREEMAVMIVRAMNYDNMAAAINNQTSQFEDVIKRVGYIELAKDLGIINGRSKVIFDPAAKATKQEAAAMLIRMYNNNNNKLDTMNGFYAIKSIDQADKINSFDSVGYGWSRLDYNENTKLIELSTLKKNGGQPFYVPEDFQLVVNGVNNKDTAKYLMVFGSNEDIITVNGKEEKLVSLLLNNEAAVNKLIGDLTALTSNLSVGSNTAQFDGVVIDFEGLRDNGIDKQSFIRFLEKLNAQLDSNGKKLIVCINAPREMGQQYFNGYDFAAIGQLADYVILMAHDFDTKHLKSSEIPQFNGETPLAPINSIYYAIKYTLNGGAGVPKDKLILQISFSASQWQFKNNIVLKTEPYVPEYLKIISRMKDSNTNIKAMNYSQLYESPYFTYELDGAKNIIWYEDERSVAAKAKLAKMFGIKGLSFWRLGTIPDFSGTENDSYNLDIMNFIQSLNN